MLKIVSRNASLDPIRLYLSDAFFEKVEKIQRALKKVGKEISDSSVFVSAKFPFVDVGWFETVTPPEDRSEIEVVVREDDWKIVDYDYEGCHEIADSTGSAQEQEQWSIGFIVAGSSLTSIVAERYKILRFLTPEEIELCVARYFETESKQEWKI